MSDKDDPLHDPLTAALTALHEKAKDAASDALLRPRLLAVVGIELAKRVPYMVRVHIMTVAMRVVAQHTGNQEEGVATMALLRSLLVPEKTESWGKALFNDDVVKEAINTSERYFERTKEVLEQRQATNKKDLS